MVDGACRVHGMNHAPGATGLDRICWYDPKGPEKQKLRKSMDDFLFVQFLTMEIDFIYGEGRVLLEPIPHSLSGLRDTFFNRGQRRAIGELDLMLSRGDLKAVPRSDIKISTSYNV